ncbi:MAG: UvrB/UvrC motif-containing protein [Pirellulales bacterium]
MSYDISSVLANWDYHPNQVSARLITGDDGREKIQLRLDLGLMQMELDGRPDGKRTRGHASWLDYYEHVRESRQQSDPDAEPFTLDSDDCGKLLREGIQYYHRYLSLWHLKRYELCARDTARNLRLFTFVRDHARHRRDRLQFDQWRPYVIMMHTRAVATPLIELGDHGAALKVVEAGITKIEEFLAEYEQSERASDLGELVFLRKWRKELASQVPAGETAEEPPEPADPLRKLRTQLQEAVAEERYEDAADLRDQIVRMTGSEGHEGMGETL